MTNRRVMPAKGVSQNSAPFQRGAGGRSTRSYSSKTYGFTLTEMVVVIVIIGAVLGIASAAIFATLKDTAAVGAFNQLSAHLATARALALRDGRDTALVFFRDETDEDDIVEIYMLAVFVNNNPMRLTTLESRPSLGLPKGMRVVAPDFSRGNDNEWLDPANQWFAVWFGPDGTLRTSKIDGTSAMWFDLDRDGKFESEESVVSVPMVAMYEESDFEGADGDDLNEWIVSGTDDVKVLVLNRYTGTLMPRKED